MKAIELHLSIVFVWFPLFYKTKFKKFYSFKVEFS